MPVFQLTDELIFPDPSWAEEDGLLAVGGDLSWQRLVLAYENGIFPWFNKGEEILWWSPKERFVLFTNEVRVSHSMKPLLKKRAFELSFNQNFSEVMEKCASIKRKDHSDTWITSEMKKAYEVLFRKNRAISAEVWQNSQLVGGLYGVLTRYCFCGESMFSSVSDASKYALIELCGLLQKQKTQLIDCQIYTSHLESLGARMIEREEFLHFLKTGVFKQ